MEMEIDKLYTTMTQICKDGSYKPIGCIFSNMNGIVGFSRPELIHIWEKDGEYYTWYYSVEIDPMSSLPHRARLKETEWIETVVIPQLDPYKANMELDVGV